MARILLVDDEQSMLNVLTSVLEHEFADSVVHFINNQIDN